MHGIPANPVLGNIESADAAQRAANAQQSAHVRKELAKSAAQMAEEDGFEALVLDSDTYKGGQQQRQPSAENIDRDSEFIESVNQQSADTEEQPPRQRRSYWA